MTEELVFNGIDGETGGYLLPPMSAEDISKIARGESLDKKHLKDLESRTEQDVAKNLGIKAGYDATKLEDSGWGVIFAFSDKNKVPAIKEALGELLKHRREQAGDRYKEYIGPDAYRPDEAKADFLARHGMGSAQAADPLKIPYYLLIVGDPEAIPYRFQYQLDVQYAVGRIYFDTLEEYAQYARSVVMAETGQVALPRRAVFFGVQNSGDGATNLSAKELVKPLAGMMADDQPTWKIQTFLAKDATKAQLTRLLGGDQTPALLFTASHGMGFPLGSPRQLPHQGALLCQDWPGPGKWQESIPQDFYFAGDDLESAARPLGMLAFHFACYGAGTPRLDDFAHRAFKDPAAIAPHAFVADLPRRLLGHPNGGALAAVGHVERAWGYSFLSAQSGTQLGTFESTLKQLMEGYPLGAALEFFNERYAALSTELSSELEDIKFGKVPDDTKLAGMWTANNDARSYVIVGDPAVRLPVTESASGKPVRPDMKPVKVKAKLPATTADATTFEAEAPPVDVESSSKAATEDATATTLGVTGPQAGPLAYSVSGTVTLQAAGAAAGLAAAPASFAATGIPPAAGATEFAIWDKGEGASELRDKLFNAAKSFVVRMSEAAERAVSEVTTLEVLTYTSDDMSQVKKDDMQGTALLRAITRIKTDGDIEVCVPAKGGQVDQVLWDLHSDMVQQAQINRAELIRTAVEAVSGLLKVV
jgi:hypothetical protein